MTINWKDDFAIVYKQVSLWFENASGLAYWKELSQIREAEVAELRVELEEKQQTVKAQLAEVRKLMSKIALLTEEQQEFETQVVELQQEIEERVGKINELQEILDRLEEPVAQMPVWLDGRQSAYVPYIQIPKVDEGYRVSNPTNIYTESNALYHLIDGQEIRGFKTYDKLMEIWDFVVYAAGYKSDVGDNWQPHIITLVREGGDCEDTTIVFLDACRMVGIPADKIFNAVGPTSFGYHSYPIVYLTEEDILGTLVESNGEGWYIFETTLRNLPSKTA